MLVFARHIEVKRAFISDISQSIEFLLHIPYILLLLITGGMDLAHCGAL